VSRLLPRKRRPPSESWKTFLDNHVSDLVSVDLFTVPDATFRVLFVLVVLAHRRRRLVHFNVTEHPTAAWTAQQVREAFPRRSCTPVPDPRPRRSLWRPVPGLPARNGHRSAHRAPEPVQNAFAERLTGSIRRECLDHVIVLGEKHLRGILRHYFKYCQGSRTHLSLANDVPCTRLLRFNSTFWGPSPARPSGFSWPPRLCPNDSTVRASSRRGPTHGC
jgi:hypothetical protein